MKLFLKERTPRTKFFQRVCWGSGKLQEKRAMQMLSHDYTNIVNLNQNPLSPAYCPINVSRLKKGKDCFWFCSVFYGRFLRTSIMTTPIIATKANSPAIAGIKYKSAVD